MSKPWDMARVASLRVQHKPRKVLGPVGVRPSDLEQYRHGILHEGYTRDHHCSRCGFHVCTDACLAEQTALIRAQKADVAARKEESRKCVMFDRCVAHYPGFTIMHHPLQPKGKVWAEHSQKLLIFCIQDLPESQIEQATKNAAEFESRVSVEQIEAMEGYPCELQ